MTTDSALLTYLNQCAQRVEAALEFWLPDNKHSPQQLHQAMRYSALNGGKRIRPTLVYATGAAFNAPADRLDVPAGAVELIHTYSLVHDDLPAMDDDDLRRNRPTCHKAFDEATAILVGDALQTLAFHVLAHPQNHSLSADTRLQMVHELALASGSRGMAGGQALDMTATGQEIDLVQLENMHIHKTGALIRASVRLGILCAEQVDKHQAKQLDHYAKCIGLAFQIWDDVLDVVGDPDLTGKTQGKDVSADKPTYPALLGLEGARAMAQRLSQEALDSLQACDEKAEPLRWLAQYIVKRQH